MTPEQIKLAHRHCHTSAGYQVGYRLRRGGYTLQQTVDTFKSQMYRIQAFTGWCVADNEIKETQGATSEPSSS